MDSTQHIYMLGRVCFTISSLSAIEAHVKYIILCMENVACIPMAFILVFVSTCNLQVFIIKLQDIKFLWLY